MVANIYVPSTQRREYIVFQSMHLSVEFACRSHFIKSAANLWLTRRILELLDRVYSVCQPRCESPLSFCCLRDKKRMCRECLFLKHCFRFERRHVRSSLLLRDCGISLWTVAVYFWMTGMQDIFTFRRFSRWTIDNDEKRRREVDFTF